MKAVSQKPIFLGGGNSRPLCDEPRAADPLIHPRRAFPRLPTMNHPAMKRTPLITAGMLAITAGIAMLMLLAFTPKALAQTPTCPAGQRADAKGVCYTPTSIVFQGLKPSYRVGESLTGRVITATAYRPVIVGFSLPEGTGIEAGQWTNPVLTDAHVGTHNIRIVAYYTVNDAVRIATRDFRFTVFNASCLAGQSIDDDGVCFTPAPFDFVGLNRSYAVGENLTGWLVTPYPLLTLPDRCYQVVRQLWVVHG